ncbi:hypothetical protein FRC02_000063 [Tulasnella sp. 418]|nr:hypothetical protein FRC02_000063 [Tulasnella sp. 418]
MALRLAITCTIALNALLWSKSHYYHSNNNLVKRSFVQECAPITVPLDLQCAHVIDSCPAPDTFLGVNYLQEYYCTKPSLRPVRFIGLILWLIFLFSFIGITASDFFCPNLATIAHLFGLSENIAGVTFLAFGNGSPDLFSTYSAMRANSGSLAIGELLGAATFITSVVVGSMCIIKPFHVRKTQFLRDVGFFTIAVAMLLAILIDGKIQRWEAAGLVGLYVAYVIVVIVGTWWENRRAKLRRTEQLIRAEYADDESIQIVRATHLDLPPTSSSHLDVPGRYDANSFTPTAYTDDEDLINEPYTDREPDSHQHHRELSRSRVQAFPLIPRRTVNRIFPSFFNRDTDGEGQISLPLSPASPRLRTQSSPTLPSQQSGLTAVDTTQLDPRTRLTQSQVITPSQDGRLSTSSSVVNLSASHQPNATPRLTHNQSHRHRRHSHHRPHSPTHMPSFSLLGALEFRSVINALQKESTSEALNVFDQPSPSTPYAANYYRTHHHRHSVGASTGKGGRDEEDGMSRTGGYNDEQNPWDETLRVPFDQRSIEPPHLTIDTSQERRKGKSPIPSIAIRSPAPEGGDSRLSSPPSPSTSFAGRGAGLTTTASAPAGLDTLSAYLNTRNQSLMPPGPTSASGATPSGRTPLPNIPLHLHSPLEASSSSLHLGASSAYSSSTFPRYSPPRTRWQKIKAFFRAAGRTLFPTLQHLFSPSRGWMGRIVSILAAPAVLCLTLTLPIVITREEGEDECDTTETGDEDIKFGSSRPSVIPELDEDSSSERRRKEAKLNGLGTDPRTGTLIDLDFDPELALSPSAPTATSDAMPSLPRDETTSLSSSEAEDRGESEVSSIAHHYQEELHSGGEAVAGETLGFNKWLTMTQCILGPLFASAVLFSNSPHWWIYLASASAVGVSAASLVLVFANNGKNTAGKVGRCLMGFVIAMVWIMAIADEVVSVLRTFGFIFGLSDAIIGLTVFAIGNSLADFVANLSVAVFAPIMGFSACFGGPMLNILLGVGVSGSIVLSSSSTLDHYDIEFGTTLLVSSVGLLFLLISTLVVVPLKGFRLTKAWGYTLILCYIVIMAINVVVEMKREH